MSSFLFGHAFLFAMGWVGEIIITVFDFCSTFVFVLFHQIFPSLAKCFGWPILSLLATHEYDSDSLVIK